MLICQISSELVLSISKIGLCEPGDDAELSLIILARPHSSWSVLHTVSAKNGECMFSHILSKMWKEVVAISGSDAGCTRDLLF